MASPGGLHALGRQIRIFPVALRHWYRVQSHTNPNVICKKWVFDTQLKCCNHCMTLEEQGKWKDFPLFFLYQKFLLWCGARSSEMLLLRAWPWAKCKIPWGLGLMPSPQPFLLATIVSAFVKPVLEVSNRLRALHPKLGCTAWTWSWLPRTVLLWHCLTRDQSASTVLQRCRWFGAFFCIYYSHQKNSAASEVIDLFGHSQKYTGKWLHHIFLQTSISCSVLAWDLHWLLIRSMWFG